MEEAYVTTPARANLDSARGKSRSFSLAVSGETRFVPERLVESLKIFCHD
jgi:hypothetical protein